jgi:hypothetical protein
MKNTTPRHPILIRLCDELNLRNEKIIFKKSFPEIDMNAEQVLESLQ